jgi:SNF2 family DNA or RNA helicase
MDSRYTHVITGCEKHEKPIETGGGILADEMGLGKTLTMLSAIIGTADEAKAFASNIYSDVHLSAEHAPIPSRATLVVVPSPCKSFRVL